MPKCFCLFVCMEANLAASNRSIRAMSECESSCNVVGSFHLLVCVEGNAAVEEAMKLAPSEIMSKQTKQQRDERA